ncbi:phosphatase PAP2 family protein [bacterium]|nr:phosphatase PAP2 family protein [bacterium]
MSALIPIVVILVCQIPPPGMRMRLGMGTYSRFEDASSAILGLAYSLVTGTCFQVILKKSVGGYRPHFLSVCEPVIPPTNDGGSAGRGFQSVMYLPTDVCTGDPHRIRIAQESFPSGHTQIAFAGYIYLAIYLNAHLRVFSTSASATATANTTTTTPPARRPRPLEDASHLRARLAGHLSILDPGAGTPSPLV